MPAKKSIYKVNVLNERWLNKHIKVNGLSSKDIQLILLKSFELMQKEILTSDFGVDLPHNFGRILVLKEQNRRNKLFSITNKEQKPKELYNLHSYNYIYSFNWKSWVHGVYPDFLWRFKANRETLKKPLYNIIHKGLDNFKTKKEFKNGF